MVLNQLFISKPPIKLLKKIIKGFGINNLNDTKEFCYLDMINLNTLSIFHTLENELRKYYIPCKQKIYFENIQNLTNKEAIVILRQLLKIHNYDLYSREKFIKGIKYSVYKIISKNNIIHEKKPCIKTQIDTETLETETETEIEIEIETKINTETPKINTETPKINKETTEIDKEIESDTEKEKEKDIVIIFD